MQKTLCSLICSVFLLCLVPSVAFAQAEKVFPEAEMFEGEAVITSPLSETVRSSKPLGEQGGKEFFSKNSLWTEIDPEYFEPSKGDFFMADLENSVGYLIDEHSQKYITFPILSGRRQFASYIGRYYFAETPDQTWTGKERNILGDRVTFAKSGRFIRLYDGEKRTSYGIHGHLYFSTMIARENKYVSYGCVLVSDKIMDLVEKSFYANGGSLKVVTTKNQQAFEFLRK